MLRRSQRERVELMQEMLLRRSQRERVELIQEMLLRRSQRERVELMQERMLRRSQRERESRADAGEDAQEEPEREIDVVQLLGPLVACTLPR
ncbi:hypothetical protein CesoFtcFv8_007777 [Champsocephalus esox]|uniref:Uncharacterized protein n=1 Tax=Champsocephalus esox TaxID=159716 RepID=A0AAN8CJG0_9TELE|nr:hypothetical protein CesoFtcFv8_007777 [Champsocephalus esox]